MAAGLAVGLARARKSVAAVVAVPVLLLLWLSLEPLGNNDGALLFLVGSFAYGAFSALAQRPVARERAVGR
ncbi:hypothetical protein [Nocardioides zeae]